jgi:acyl carrier protein
MTQGELLTTVGTAIKDVLNNPSLEVKPESRLINDLGLESIDLLDVSSELEGAIGLEIDFKEVAEFVKSQSGNSVSDMKGVKVQHLISFIESKQQ